MGGIDAAVAMVCARAGKGYAPRLAEALVNHAPVVLADDAPSVWNAVLAAEPGPQRRLSGDDAERAIRAMGEYADMKSGYFRGHSPRPHRPPHKVDAAADQLRREAREGRLDTEAVEAVLGAAGQETRAPERPAGLSEREVEVLRCVARGLTNKEIATTLDISIKTAGHHVELIFAKIGATTRAAAGLFAMQNDLMV